MKRFAIFDSGTDFQLERSLSYCRARGIESHVLTSSSRREELIAKLQGQGLHSACIGLEWDENGIDLSPLLTQMLRHDRYDQFVCISKEMSVLKELKNVQVQEVSRTYPIFRALHRANLKNILFFHSNALHAPIWEYLVDDFVGYGRKKRCFIVGNGPSLNQIDMSRLADEVTFGCNRGYLGFPKWGFEFTFWGIIDRVQLEQNLLEWEKHIPSNTVKILPYEYLPIVNLKNLCPANFDYDFNKFPSFGHTPDTFFIGSNVVHFLMQVAVAMEFESIYLVGVDNRYSIPESAVNNDRWTAVHSQNHFHSDYCEGGKRLFVPPRYEIIEKGFEHAAQWCEENGKNVLNATPGSQLKYFPTVDYSSLF